MFLSGDVVYSKHLSGIARTTLCNKEGPIMPDVIPEAHRIMENLLREYQEAAPSPCKLFLLSELSEKQLHTLLNLKDCRPVGDHSDPGISGPVEDESFPFRRAHKAMLSLLSKDVYDRCSYAAAREIRKNQSLPETAGKALVL